MKGKEKFKDVQLGNYWYRIEKFDAGTGSYIVYKLLAQILPIIPMLTKEVDADAFKAQLPSVLTKLTKEDFKELQTDCLKVCSRLEGNSKIPMPIVTDDGRMAVEDLNNDTMTVMFLTVQAIAFNMSSFFDENTLKGFLNLTHM
jgi:hypothetical protein